MGSQALLRSPAFGSILISIAIQLMGWRGGSVVKAIASHAQGLSSASRRPPRKDYKFKICMGNLVRACLKTNSGEAQFHKQAHRPGINPQYYTNN